MRIAFDGTTLRPGRTGVGYYTEHLLHHLVQEGPRHDVTVLSNRPVDTARPLPAAVRVETSRWRMPRMVWMQTLAPRMLGRLAPDVAHFTNGMMPLASPVPTVVTIHDMSLALYPRYHPPRRVLLNRPLVDLAVRRADAIITVSQSARRDIVRHYRLRAEQVHVVHGSGGAGVPAGSRCGSPRERPRPLRPRGPRHPLRRHDRAEKESAEAARCLRAAPHERRPAPSAGVRRSLRLAQPRHRGADRAAADRGGGPLHRIRAVRGSAGDLQPGGDVRVSVALRRLRSSGHRSDGVRHAGHHRSGGRARRGRRRRRRTRRSSSTPTASVARWSSWRRAASGASSWRRSGCCARVNSRGGAPRAKRSRSTGWLPADRPTAVAGRPRRFPTARSKPHGRDAGPRRRRARHRNDGAYDDRRPVRPGLFPAVRPEAVGGATAISAARHALRGGVRARARLPGRAVRRDAGDVGGGMGRGARPPSPARRGPLRRQLQLPVQDVPAAHAAGGAGDDRCRTRARASRSSSPDPTPAITRRCIWSAAPTWW